MSNPNTTGFHNLPFEVIVKICLKLDCASSILAFRAANRYLAEIFESSAVLKYKVKALAWGYETTEDSEVGASSATSLDDKIKGLTGVVKNFKALDWKHKVFETSKSFSVHAVVDGLLIYVLSPDSRDLFVAELPTRGKSNQDMVVRTKETLPFTVAAIIADPTQNLLVLREEYVPSECNVAVTQTFVPLGRKTQHPLLSSSTFYRFQHRSLATLKPNLQYSSSPFRMSPRSNIS